MKHMITLDFITYLFSLLTLEYIRILKLYPYNYINVTIYNIIIFFWYKIHYFIALKMYRSQRKVYKHRKRMRSNT